MPPSLARALRAVEPIAFDRMPRNAATTTTTTPSPSPTTTPSPPPPARRGLLAKLSRRSSATGNTTGPLFRFGLVADVQYAAKDAQVRGGGGRRRRIAWSESLAKVSAAVRAWNNENGLAFVLSLGDIVDGNEAYMEACTERELRAVLEVLEGSRVPVRHILGNHCRSLSLPKLCALLGLTNGTYYSFAPAPGWRVICLDTTELCSSAVDTDPSTRAMIARMAVALDRPSHHFHGAVSDVQLEWLAHTLDQSACMGERVLVMTHYPLRGARVSHLALNSKAIVDVLESSRANVVAVFAGHDHVGATLLPDTQNKLRSAFITLPAMVESPQSSNAFATVSVYADGSLDVSGHGTVPSYRVRPNNM